MPIVDPITRGEVSGERFVPSSSNPYEILTNLDRYRFAMPHVIGKMAMDMGFGSGLGTYLYSLVAERVYAVDYDKQAHKYAKRFPIPPCKVVFLKANAEEELVVRELPKVEVCVAMEFLEHLEDPATFLRNLKADKLVFSLPFDSLAISKFHKYRIRGGSEGMEDVKALIGQFYDAECTVQADRWILGVGTRKKGV